MALAKITFHPGASEEYAAAFSWYYKRGAVLAANFESEIARGVRLISQNPLRWAKFDSQRRRFIVRKFPYSIIYEVHGDDVAVLAVAHGKRRLTTGGNASQINRLSSIPIHRGMVQGSGKVSCETPRLGVKGK